MKYLFIFFLAISCSPYNRTKTKYSLPLELEDCRIFLISDGAKDLYVVKCPNADTTTSWTRSCGKNCETTEHVTLVYR
jgi:hypothetical protein